MNCQGMPISYVLISCDLGFEESIINELMKIPEVKEARGVYGAFDIFAKVQSDDIAQHQGIIDKIRRIRNVRSTNTHMAIEEQGGR